MADKVHYEVVTPLKLIRSEEADMVVVPGGDGDLGILPGHAPLLSTLRPGTVDIYDGEKVRDRLFLEGGFAEVTAERCTLLAQEAVPLKEITLEQAEERVKKARNDLESADSFEHRKHAGREMDAAEAMLQAVKSQKKH